MKEPLDLNKKRIIPVYIHCRCIIEPRGKTK